MLQLNALLPGNLGYPEYESKILKPLQFALGKKTNNKTNMKSISKELIILFMFLFFYSLVWGQGGKYNLRIDGILVQYLKIEEKEFTSVPGYYNFPISPGIEMVLSRNLFNGISIGTGIELQQGNVSSFVNEIQKRFHFTEISIPILIKKTFPMNDNVSCYFSTGIYLGKMISVRDDYYTSFGWEKSSDIQEVDYYSNDKTMSDVYFDFGFSKPLTSKFDVSFSPFLKYRINTTWLNYHFRKVHYGIKINVSLKL